MNGLNLGLKWLIKVLGMGKRHSILLKKSKKDQTALNLRTDLAPTWQTLRDFKDFTTCCGCIDPWPVSCTTGQKTCSSQDPSHEPSWILQAINSLVWRANFMVVTISSPRPSQCVVVPSMSRLGSRRKRE